MWEQSRQFARLYASHRPLQRNSVTHKMFAITAAFAALALASSSYAVPVNSTALASRAYTNARFTWYNPSVGQGACGGWNSDSDFVSTPCLGPAP